MARFERINEPTPCGGDYSEIHYFNDAGESVDKTVATKCAICEYDKNGNLLNETWGTCNIKE